MNASRLQAEAIHAYRWAAIQTDNARQAETDGYHEEAEQFAEEAETSIRQAEYAAVACMLHKDVRPNQ
jgi:hypothetical protein